LCQPERTNGPTPYRDHDSVRGFPSATILVGNHRSARKGKIEIVDSDVNRDSDADTPFIGCVSVRPLSPPPLGSGFIIVRPRSFAHPKSGLLNLILFPSLWLPNPIRVVPSTFHDVAILAGVFQTPIESTAEGVRIV
jgi:hypothetical protein